MTRSNGSSTPIYMIFTVIVVSIGLLLYDYSRIMAQQEALNRALESASEVALAQYDKDLFKNFGVHALNKTRAKEEVSTWINGCMLPFGIVENIRVSFDESTNLANPNMIKEAILQAHQERFIVEFGVDVLEAWSFIQNIDKLFEAMEIFTGLLVVAEKLQSAYSALSGSYDEIRTVFQNLKPVQTKLYLSELQELWKAQKKIESRITEIKALLVDSQLTKLQKETLKIELDQMITAKSSQSKAIDDMYLQVLDLESAIGRLYIYNQEWLDFQKALGKGLEIIDEQLSAYEDKQQEGATSQRVVLVIKEMNENLSRANTIVEKSVRIIGAELPTLQNLILVLKEIYQNPLEISVVEEIDFNPSRFLEISAWEAINCFAPSVDLEALKNLKNIDVKSILVAVWQAVAGDLFKLGNAYLSSIDEKIYSSLPSQLDGNRQEGVKEIVHEKDLFWKESSDEPSNDFVAGIQKRSKQNSILWSNLRQPQVNRDVMMERMVVADYILTYFSYNVPSKFEKNNRMSMATLPCSEVEYILFGNRLSSVNAALTDGTLGAICLMTNSISLLINKQPQIQQLAIELSALSAGIGYPLMYAAVLSGWSALEAYLDLKALHDGKKSPVIKMANQFRVDFSAEKLMEIAQWILNLHDSNKLNDSNGVLVGKAPRSDHQELAEGKSSTGLKFDISVELSYRDWLRILLLMQDFNLQLRRVSDLWTMESAVHIEDFYRGLSIEVDHYAVETLIYKSTAMLRARVTRGFQCKSEKAVVE